jgi:pimeloyl-ACP methyl ester carboxylesterase
MAELTVRGVRLHVQRLGGEHPGPVVVFLHGLVMDNLSSWYFTVANVAAQHSRVLLYDLRGHGKSERPAQGYGLDDMVADLAGVLDAADERGPVVLVGNSFGGLLALAFARAYPARVAGLVLVDAHLGDDQFGPEMAATLRLRGEERDRRIAESFASWLGRNSDRKRNRLAESARELVHGTSLVDDLARTPPLTDLAHIDAPVLALYGERSDLRQRGEDVLAALPRAKIEILDGCTHSILWEATAAVKQRILSFLEERR